MKSSLKDRAQNAVAYARKTGKLVPQPCEVCGEEKVHGHHYLGYEKENSLKVRWFCAGHHWEQHFRTATQRLRYELVAYIAAESTSHEQLLAIQKIIKQQNNE